ncbi:hypothetical protein [Streptomyces sp. JNUCC 63]
MSEAVTRAVDQSVTVPVRNEGRRPGPALDDSAHGTGGPLRRVVTELVGRPGTWTGGVWVWDLHEGN